ncbi:TetR/AcrR family transcriptional regulator [Spirilliplanes yamanashiensis]|uniref:TetR/AcrR family transcriptional regulator n=1 Tax=Spirilliplanes yamanashiensis TaxID=42233 RepID=UPI001EF34D1C|nr:TetR/AcrR family transcriptional regulator [Spirilliplanes yamanashiensis]MDP9815733.1 AcrR family transcriptional regulator [Spirilliplanes yamanashiensis]
MNRHQAGRLSADDWAAAALDAIGRGGLAAVAVEPLAALLGATKGSFYWHFPNRDALVTAALRRWEARHTEAVIRLVEAEPDPLRRLRLLLVTVIESTGHDSVEVAVLATAAHPLVAPVLARVTERRISYTQKLFRDLGFTPAEARDRGLLAVTAYLGHAQLAHATPDLVQGTAAARRRYADRVIAVLTGR